MWPGPVVLLLIIRVYIGVIAHCFPHTDSLAFKNQKHRFPLDVVYNPLVLGVA